MRRRTVWCTAEDWQKQTWREIVVISTSRSWTSLVCRQTMGLKTPRNTLTLYLAVRWKMESDLALRAD